MSSSTGAKTPYFYNGQAVSTIPFSAKVSRFLNTAYIFLGSYLTTLFSLDSTQAAQDSPFAVRNRTAGRRPGVSDIFRGFGGGGGGGGPGSGGAGGGGSRGTGSGGRKLGSVDEVRGPECSSCG